MLRLDLSHSFKEFVEVFAIPSLPVDQPVNRPLETDDVAREPEDPVAHNRP
ncbi:hypothetical protein [Acuticoccus yangtzensis]|uniref:hypothetical protein n=1 Tax=Acuticoccus yangtzensis TaxID=1443441 RepID=UPI001300A520|nr:hypothetical protein [Acuticoccus yangtzensis]